jgi:parallel beta helix pectate lyase-like protein
MKTRLYLKIPIICASLVLGAATLHAQATRTWVSGVGDDANPCSRTAPCKTFAGAISKTATGGEINVLDPGGFGAVTITKAITISSECFEAGVLVSGTNGIIVNTPAGSDVMLKGIDFEGLGTGLNGVTVISASKVAIQKCSIRHFTQNGVNIAGPAGTRVLMQDCTILSNNNGVSIAGNPAGSANVGIVLRTTIDNNAGSSINVASGSVLFLGGSKLFGSVASVTNAGTFTSFGDNELQGTGTPGNTIALR